MKGIDILNQNVKPKYLLCKGNTPHSQWNTCIEIESIDNNTHATGAGKEVEEATLFLNNLDFNLKLIWTK